MRQAEERDALKSETGSAGRPRRYTLDELLAQCDPEAPLSDDDRAWLDGPPVGLEVI